LGDRIARLPQGTLLAAAAGVFVLLSLFAIVGDSAVDDEVAHLPAGYSYWATGDFRLNPEHPPLVKLLAGLPLIAVRPQLPEDEDSWKDGNEWRWGFQFLYLSGNRSDLLVALGRLPMMVFGIVVIIAATLISRELFGPRGALVTLVLTTCCPELLAHSHLVNTDAAVTALILLSVMAFWKFLQKPTALGALLSGLSLGGALISKYSAVVLLPASLWTFVLAAATRFRGGTGEGAVTSPSAGKWTAFGLLIGCTAVMVVWASYGFRYRASPDPDFRFQWTFDRTKDSTIGRAARLANDRHLLPEAYLYGFSYMYEHSQVRRAYALGRHSDTGWWWYFPFGFLVKTPTVSLVLIAWGLVASIRRHLAGDSRDYFLYVPLMFFWGFAISSTINIGFRHVLPVYPFLFILAGGIEIPSAGAAKGPWRGRAIGGLLALAVASTVGAAPHFISYFNLPSQAFFEKHDLLADSSLDWGQDLRRLKAWMDREGVSEITLSYRGNASPRQLGLRHRQVAGFNEYSRHEFEWRWAREVKPGDYFAISACNLHGIEFEDKNRYLSRLGKLKPVAAVGDSILVYLIPDGMGWKE
jgi:4-amino-4-deoxy-L-arabinose transferase-like glycosyltransferase